MNNYLNYILQERNISKTELSKIIGLDRTTISKMCSNKEYAKKMKIDTAYKICKVLDISLEEFIEKMFTFDNKGIEFKITKKTQIKKNYTNKDIIEKLNDIEKYLNNNCKIKKGGLKNGRKEN